MPITPVGSRIACNFMLRLVLHTWMVLPEGRDSGRADAKDHSSSSFVVVGGGGAGDAAGVDCWLLIPGKGEG